MLTRIVLGFVCSLTLMLQSSQDYPTKPVRMIEPFGGGVATAPMLMCHCPLQLSILKPRGSVVLSVNPQVSHVVTSDRIWLSRSASLQRGRSGPARTGSLTDFRG